MSVRKNGVFLNLLVVILFLTLTSVQANYLDWKSVSSHEFSKKEILAAKNLEDFYWAVRQKDIKRLNYNHSLFKKRHGSKLALYLPLLEQGLVLAKQIKKKKFLSTCPEIDPTDSIFKKFTREYKRYCVNNNIKAVLASSKLTDSQISFLNNNLDLFTKRTNIKPLREKLKKWDQKTIASFSKALTDSILKTKRLPHKELLEYIALDHKVTRFIQKNQLFASSVYHNYSKIFSNLVKEFKNLYIKGDNEGARESLLHAIEFYESNKDKINDSKAWRLFITSGKKVARRDDYPLALDLFRLSEKSGDEEQVFESKFQTLFAFYREGKLSDARKFIKEEDFVEKFDKLNSKLRFWVSRVYAESKEYKKAKTLFKRQIEINPLSFYSILSLKKLQSLSPSQEVSLIINEDIPSLNTQIGKKASEKIALFNLFSQANTTTLSNALAYELRALDETKFFPNLGIHKAKALKPYFLIKFFSQSNSHLHSFKVAYSNLKQGKIKLNKLVVESLFPIKYQNLAKSYAPNIENKIILSLIRQESAFNERARSAVGARGLMQIMPATGRQFVKSLKAYQLYEPELNIKIGTKFLDELLRKYDGDLIFTLSAYNAGMGNVSRWQRSIPFTTDELTNVELIPFKETRNYVKLIYRNLFFYSALEGSNESLLSPVQNSFKITLDSKH